MTFFWKEISCPFGVRIPSDARLPACALLLISMLLTRASNDQRAAGHGSCCDASADSLNGDVKKRYGQTRVHTAIAFNSIAQGVFVTVRRKIATRRTVTCHFISIYIQGSLCLHFQHIRVLRKLRSLEVGG